MAISLPPIGAARVRSYLLRLPLFTRLIVLVIILLWLLSGQSLFDVQAWGALVPEKIGISSCGLSLYILRIV